ncbi:hypothetical protein [Streptomyces chartreusis]|uniref:hypothetical protein n=1 Tax=Streptomyces chartreusis TaxID=1969 RepID=UPI00364CA38E
MPTQPARGDRPAVRRTAGNAAASALAARPGAAPTTGPPAVGGPLSTPARKANGTATALAARPASASADSPAVASRTTKQTPADSAATTSRTPKQTPADSPATASRTPKQTPAVGPPAAPPAVGNGAAAAVAARGPAGSRRRAAAAPGPRRIAVDVAAKKRVLTRHPAPAAEAVQAQRAAVQTDRERAGLAGREQTEAMAEAPVKRFDRAAFIAKFEARIAAQEPKTADAAKKLADPETPDALTPQLTGEAQSAAGAAASDVKAAAATAPDPGQVHRPPTAPLTPDRPPAAPAAPRAADAVPPPLPGAAVDLSAGGDRTRAALDGAGIGDETLRNANEPSFSAALKAKRTAEKHTDAGPADVRAREAEIRTTAQQRAAGAGKAAMAGMAGLRVTAGAAVHGGKEQARDRTQARRAEIADRLSAVYEETRKSVESTLAGLDETVRKLFEERAAEARKSFIEACTKSWWQFWREEPNCKAHANEYARRIRAAVDEVATVVERTVTAAQQQATDGRRRMTEYVSGLEPEMKEFGNRTAAGFAERFDLLDASIGERADAVVDVLAECYAVAQQEIDQAMAEVKEANKSLWEQARDAVVGVVKVLLDLKNLLVSVVRRAAGVAERIIRDPMGFLRNLAASVKGGLTLFVTRLPGHLKAALQEWLFGNLAAAGVELPEKWDLRGVIKLVLSVFGISWSFIRGELLKHMPPAMLNTVIGAVRVIGLIKDKGIGALWEELKEQAAELKDQAFEMIKSFVIETVVKAGVTWLLSLITPAGALVKAVMAVYDFLTFLVEKARALAEFVNGILDTLEEICGGVSQKVVAKIDASLARVLPLAIDLFARVLKLGAIPAKVKSVLEKVGAPVRGFIARLITKAAAFAKRLLAGGAKALGKLAGKADRRTEDEKKRDVRAGVEAGAAVVDRLHGTFVGERLIRGVLLAIRVRYGLKYLKPVLDGDRWTVEGGINPTHRKATRKKPPLKGEKEATPDQEKSAGALVAASVAGFLKALAIWNTVYRAGKADTGKVVATSTTKAPEAYSDEALKADPALAHDPDHDIPGRDVRMPGRDPGESREIAERIEAEAIAALPDEWTVLPTPEGRAARIKAGRKVHTRYLDPALRTTPKLRREMALEGKYIARSGLKEKSNMPTTAHAEKKYYERHGGSVRAIGVAGIPVCEDCKNFFITRALKADRHIVITGFRERFKTRAKAVLPTNQMTHIFLRGGGIGSVADALKQDKKANRSGPTNK